MLNSFVRRRVAGLGFVGKAGSAFSAWDWGTTLLTLDECERDDVLPLCEGAGFDGFELWGRKWD
jgi:photosystem II stability/assembly factor-like uncharacterized protein